MSDAIQPPTEARPSGSRRLKYALIASLALNLLVIGAVAGTMIGFSNHPPPRGHHPRGEDFGLMGLTRTLPEARRKEIRKELRAERGKLRPLVDEVHTARREAADKLAAEPFDRAALEAAINAAGERERILRQQAVNTFLGQAERLTPSERRTLADWWRKKSQPLPERKGRAKKDKPAEEAQEE